MLRACNDRDFEEILAIINDGAQAYRAVIPSDRFAEPYMPAEKLRQEIADGIEFWGYEDGGALVGVMGIQHVLDVTLIRHAYVRRESQRRGYGTRLLEELRKLARGPILIGTWADAESAIRFYERHGFRVVGVEEKNGLLQKYWKVPERQVETSVVLADEPREEGFRG